MGDVCSKWVCDAQILQCGLCSNNRSHYKNTHTHTRLASNPNKYEVQKAKRDTFSSQCQTHKLCFPVPDLQLSLDFPQFLCKQEQDTWCWAFVPKLQGQSLSQQLFRWEWQHQVSTLLREEGTEKGQRANACCSGDDRVAVWNWLHHGRHRQRAGPGPHRLPLQVCPEVAATSESSVCEKVFTQSKRSFSGVQSSLNNKYKI